MKQQKKTRNERMEKTMATTYYFLPTRNLFGEDSVQEAGTLLQSLGGKKAMIVTDSFLATSGMAEDIQKILTDAGVESVIFGGAEPNPKDTNVEDGLKVFNENECDSIISLGGGSSHDCAKAIALVASNGGNIRDYEGVDKSTNPLCPMIAINTTAGTASEITRFCIITDTSRHVKMAIVDRRVTPQIAINDPKLMVGMPPSLTAATGMDALTHAIEGYITKGAWEMTDMFHLKAIELISKNLRGACENTKEGREGMALGQYIAGMGFSNVGLGIVHSMAHALGAVYDTPHGVANAILLPTVMEYNAPCTGTKYKDIAVAMGVEGVENMSQEEYRKAAVDAVKKLSADVGIPADLKAIVKAEDVDFLAQSAMDDACRPGNPKDPTFEDIKNLYLSLM